VILGPNPTAHEIWACLTIELMLITALASTRPDWCLERKRLEHRAHMLQHLRDYWSDECCTQSANTNPPERSL
jgi:hypothetical protein